MLLLLNTHAGKPGSVFKPDSNLLMNNYIHIYSHMLLSQSDFYKWDKMTNVEVCKALCGDALLRDDKDGALLVFSLTHLAKKKNHLVNQLKYVL